MSRVPFHNVLFISAVRAAPAAARAVSGAAAFSSLFLFLPYKGENGVHSFTLTDSSEAVAIVVKGDTNLNGGIDPMDVTLLKQYYAGNRTISALAIFACNQNGDGEIVPPEVTMLSQVYVGNHSYAW